MTLRVGEKSTRKLKSVKKTKTSEIPAQTEKLELLIHFGDTK